MNVVSFSLWGDKPKYTVGALKNARLASIHYRGWQCRFYCDGDTVPKSVIESLQSLDNTTVVVMKASEEPHWSMFWRFYAIDDVNVERCVFRDADSRIGQREAMAVQEWISSGKGFHMMRDHPQHGTPIMGGMWGAVSGKIKDMRGLIDSYYKQGLTRSSLFGLDQDFLTHSILPIAQGDMIEHDEFFARKPFPIPRDPKHFVGQVYDENDNPQF